MAVQITISENIKNQHRNTSPEQLYASARRPGETDTPTESSHGLEGLHIFAKKRYTPRCPVELLKGRN